ncbi:unnamed protein product [Meloidogyne enterolobii]|uniref:Uncharacterized protein n=1 Tax=Meloidogyne enterolobii TaxID=390850 RepID=A0ACB1AU09_MELEN
MNLLPAETKLDIFKCLNFNQLNNFQLSNRHFCELIAKYNKELAIKVFYSVELVVWKNYVCKDLEYSRKELDLNLSEENKLKVHNWGEGQLKEQTNQGTTTHGTDKPRKSQKVTLTTSQGTDRSRN